MLFVGDGQGNYEKEEVRTRGCHGCIVSAWVFGLAWPEQKASRNELFAEGLMLEDPGLGCPYRNCAGLPDRSFADPEDSGFWKTWDRFGDGSLSSNAESSYAATRRQGVKRDEQEISEEPLSR